MSSFFAPFSETNDYYLENNNQFNQFKTFEELITERGTENKVNYDTLFENIKNKLFDLKKIEATEIIDIGKFKEPYIELKKSVCDIYINFITSESELNEAKEKYSLFCENIKKTITSIDICGINDESDVLLKELIEKKIDSYYINLNLDQLKNNLNISFNKLQETKQKINIIFGIIPVTICQICLENQIEYFVDPCGHTLCGVCKDKCVKVSSSCHYCRTNRNSFKRIYL